MEQREQLEERVKQAFLQLRLCDDHSAQQQQQAQEELKQVLHDVKALGEPRLLKQQRRGAFWEYRNMYPSLEKLLKCLDEKDISPPYDGKQMSAKRSLELWREAEALTLRPHSFTLLKQLPELRQIISHAAVPAIHSCAGTMQQLAAASQSQLNADREAEILAEASFITSDNADRDPRNKVILRKAAAIQERRAAKASAAAAAAAGGSGDGETAAAAAAAQVPLFSPELSADMREDTLDANDMSLLQHLAPGLRLCLAAEVAVGMLCAGQPPPPDTPEHAAALQMFVIEAWKHVDAELSDKPSSLHDAASMTGSTGVERNTARGVRRLWQHMDLDLDLNADFKSDRSDPDRQQQQQAVVPPRLSKVAGWGLAPHMDLQMQLPPQQLLQLLLQMITQQRQQQQQDGNQQLQQEDAAAGEGSAAAAAEAAAVGVLPFNLSDLGQSEQSALRAVVAAPHLLDAHARLSVILNTNSSTSSSSSEASGAVGSSSSSDGLLLSRDIALALLRHSFNSFINADEIWADLIDDFKRMPGRVTAAQLLQLLASTCTHSPSDQQQDETPEQQQQQGTDGATTTDPAAAAEFTEAEVDGILQTAFPRLLLNFLHGLTVHLLLQFVSDMWDAGKGAASPAWQQAVPLQVLLLCGQMHRLARIIGTSGATPDALLLPSSSSSRCSEVHSHSQQQQQQEDVSAELGSDSDPNLKLLQAVSLVTSMLQALRQFRRENDRLNSSATAAAAAGDNAVNGGSSSSSVGPGMDPQSFFSSTGPMASGVLGFAEPSLPLASCSSSSSSSNTSHTQQQQQQQEEAEKTLVSLWVTLIGSSLWDSSMAAVDAELREQLQSASFFECAIRTSTVRGIAQLQEQLRSNQSNQSNDLQKFDSVTDALTDKRPASALHDALQAKGVTVTPEMLSAAPAAGQTVAGQLLMSRAALMSALGLTGQRCCRMAQEVKDQQAQLLMDKMRGSGLGGGSFVMFPGKRDEDYCMTSSSSSEDEADQGAAAAAVRRRRRRSEGVEVLKRRSMGRKSGAAAAAAAAAAGARVRRGAVAADVSSSSSEDETASPKEQQQQQLQSSSSTAQQRRNERWQRRLQRQQQGVISSDDDADVVISSDDDNSEDYWHVRQELGSHPKQQAAQDRSVGSQRALNQPSTRSSSSSSSSSFDEDELLREVMTTEARDSESGLDLDMPADRTALGSSWRWAKRSVAAAKITAAAVCKTSQMSRRKRHKALREAQAHYRRAAAVLTSRLSPLWAFHTRWLQQQQHASALSTSWWRGDLRREIVTAAATGRETDRRVMALTVAQAGWFPQPDLAGKPSSSSSSGEWPDGEHDYHPFCRLCQGEQRKQHKQQQQQQQQHDTGPNTSSSSSSSSASDPVSYSDPFMWRRLLWQLLGKLSPEAQAFYAQYLAVCPHCPDDKIWSLIKRSIVQQLWSYPGHNMAVSQLVAPLAGSGNELRTARIVQYARALNASYIKGYCAGTVVLAQQLLLALSPLHAQLLPRPETAFLCPSSFRPAIGKLLMTELLSRPVLDMFAHGQAQLSMWHVWWHIGLRKFAASKQQQQQGVGGVKMPGSSSGVSRSSSVEDCSSINALYLDPEARLYAVGFAARQMTGASHAPTHHSSSCSTVNAAATLQAAAAATQQLRQMLLMCGAKLEEPSSSSSSSSSSGLMALTGPEGVQASLDRSSSSSSDAPAGPETPKRGPDSSSSSSSSPAAPDTLQQANTAPDKTTSDSSGSSSSSKKDAPGGSSSKAPAGHDDAPVALQQAIFAALHSLTDPQQQQQAVLDEAPQRLRQAAAWPRDLLAHAAVRNAPSAEEQSNAEAHQAIVLKYLLHKPDLFVVMEKSEFDKQKEGDTAKQQQQQGEAAAAAAGQLSDIAQMALQPPLPLDAFVDPQMWWQRQQELLRLDRTCDHCGIVATLDQLTFCEDCACALCCSEGCQQLDAEGHGLLCNKLQAAKNAYSHDLTYFNTTGQLVSKGSFPLVTQCLQAPAEPEAASLGSSSSSIVPWMTLENTIVPSQVLVQKAGVMLAGLTKASRAGQLAGVDLDMY